MNVSIKTTVYALIIASIIISSNVCAQIILTNANSTPQLSIDQDIKDYLEIQLSYGGSLYQNEVGYTSVSEHLNGVRAMGTGSGTTILYVNGILTNRVTFEASVRELEILISGVDILPNASGGYGFYNISGIQNAADHGNVICTEILEGFWIEDNSEIVNDCKVRFASNGIVDEFSQLSGQYLSFFRKFIATDDYVDQNAVERLAGILQTTVGSGQRVIIVAHSQGNFYVRDAMKEILSRPYGKEYVESIGVLMLGSPINRVFMPNVANSKRVSECNDIITKISLITSCIKGNAGISWFKRLLSKFNFGAVVSNWNFEAHDFRRTYLRNSVVLPKVKEALRELDQIVKYPQTTYISSERVFSTDRLNVRKIDGTLMYTVDFNSQGSVFGQTTQFLNGYNRVEVAFDSSVLITLPNGTRSTVGAMSVFDQHGYVATNWLSYDRNHPYAQSEVIALDTYEEVQYELLESDSDGGLQLASQSVYASLEIPYPSVVPNSDDELNGIGGCSNCSTTAPGTFAMNVGTLVCSSGTSNALLSWDSSAGAQNYEVYRDSELVTSGLTGTTYSDSGLELDKQYVYSIKARNGEGSRNASTAWYADVPETLCGAPEPPPPYSGPAPLVTNLDPTFPNPGNVVLRGKGTASEDGDTILMWFEYGTSTTYSNSTNPFVATTTEEEYTLERSVSIACEQTIHFRTVARYGNAPTAAWIYGNDQVFETPRCSPPVPTGQKLTHDPINNTLILEWDGFTGTSSMSVELMCKIVSDPRSLVTNDVVTGIYSRCGSGTPHEGHWVNDFTNPQPSGEYCYYLYTHEWANGDAGKSLQTDEVCITVEGVLELTEDDVRWPSGPYLNVNAGDGIRIEWTGIRTTTHLQRSIDGGEFTDIRVVEDGGLLRHLDQGLVDGQEYCYRFMHPATGIIQSESACSMYVDSLPKPTITVLREIEGDYYIDMEVDVVANVSGGYLQIYRYYQGNWDQNGTMNLNVDMIEGTLWGSRVFFGSDVTNACYYAVYKTGLSESPQSTEMCLTRGNGEVSIYPDPDQPPIPTVSATVFTEGLDIGNDWSWCDESDASYSGYAYEGSTSFRAVCSAWQGINIFLDAFDSSSYDRIEFMVYVESGATNNLRIRFVDAANGQTGYVYIDDYVDGDLFALEWTFISIPLADFTGITGVLDNLMIQPESSATLLLDDVSFVSGETSSNPPTPPDRPPDDPPIDPVSMSIFSEKLDIGDDWSWCTESDENHALYAFEGNISFRAVCNAWEGINIYLNTFETVNYDSLSMAFYVESGSTNNLRIRFVDTTDTQSEYVYLSDYVVGDVYVGRWYVISIPLSDFTGIVSSINNLMIQPESSATLLLDEVRFVAPL